MPDTNMNTAYKWASELADKSHLIFILDINQRVELISEINELLGRYINDDLKSGGFGLFEKFPEIVKEIILNKIDDIIRHYKPLETNQKYRKSIGLRLWSGCLSAAKVIALETRDGPNTPEIRAEGFQILEPIANADPIFCAGLESAPLFKKRNQQCFTFIGVPLVSPVRRYPNEYLMDK
jgi:hypothetical protein